MQKDPDQNIVKPCFAVIYTPSQRRKRFPENCVQPFGSAEEALAAASEQEDCHAAEVMGPSRSSEGFRLYYLLRWL
ncbi:MAG: hypothetical protein PVJ68_14110 [Candidatus Thiodiazotropha sp.]|jgi:hypothetical protein